MEGNTFGRLFRFSSFGESHGAAIGGIIDGFPPGIQIDYNLVEINLKRRSSAGKYGSGRSEADSVEYLSGILDGISLGTPIAFIIRNKDQISSDYDVLKDFYRPSHADFSWEAKYGHRDYRGGGRSSARETTNWVVAGSFAQMFLSKTGIQIQACTYSIGGIQIDPQFRFSMELDPLLNCPDLRAVEQMTALIESARAEGETLGGTISCIIKGVPAGWGEPVFDKIGARLAHAMMSLNAVRGFEIGSGFRAANMKGSEHNDLHFRDNNGNLRTATNHSGGIQGGVTNGEDIWFALAIKPIASIQKKQLLFGRNESGEQINILGRHDVCVVPRAVPIVEALSWLVIADFALLQQRYFGERQ
jgi:chorismate synthase